MSAPNQILIMSNDIEITVEIKEPSDIDRAHAAVDLAFEKFKKRFPREPCFLNQGERERWLETVARQMKSP